MWYLSCWMYSLKEASWKNVGSHIYTWVWTLLLCSNEVILPLLVSDAIHRVLRKKIPGTIRHTVSYHGIEVYQKKLTARKFFLFGADLYLSCWSHWSFTCCYCPVVYVFKNLLFDCIFKTVGHSLMCWWIGVYGSQFHSKSLCLFSLPHFFIETA